MKYTRFFGIMTFVLLLFALPACNNQQSAEEKAKEELQEAGEAVSDLINKERDKLAKDLEAMRNNVNREIEEMRKEISEAKAETEDAVSDELQMLNEKANQLEAYLEEVAEVSENSWQNWKAEAESMLKDLEQKLKELGDSE